MQAQVEDSEVPGSVAAHGGRISSVKEEQVSKESQWE